MLLASGTSFTEALRSGQADLRRSLTPESELGPDASTAEALVRDYATAVAAFAATPHVKMPDAGGKRVTAPQAISIAQQALIDEIADQVDDPIAAAGLVALVSSGDLRTATRAMGRQVQRQLRDAADSQARRYIGVSLSDVRSVRHGLRLWARRQIDLRLARFAARYDPTGLGLYLGRELIRFIRRETRNQRVTPERVRRTVNGLLARAQALTPESLPGGTPLAEVRRRLQGAARQMSEMGHLLQDLERQGRGNPRYREWLAGLNRGRHLLRSRGDRWISRLNRQDEARAAL